MVARLLRIMAPNSGEHDDVPVGRRAHHHLRIPSGSRPLGAGALGGVNNDARGDATLMVSAEFARTVSRLREMQSKEYFSRKHASAPNRQHPWFTRTFWPAWFAMDNVFPNPDHLPYLQRRFERESLIERIGSVPYIPLIKMPYYQFVGRKRAE